MIRILVDSSSDYKLEDIQKKNMEMVALNVAIGEKSYKDQYEILPEQMYEELVKGEVAVKTSQPSPADFVDVFEKIKESQDEVICILLSSALSGTYQSACIAKEMVDYDKIYLIDSLTVTIANVILADYAYELVGKGLTAPEIVEKIEEKKSSVKILAAVDTLKYLYLGGRVSKTTAVLGDAVSIKPAIEISKDGKVAVIGKYLGVNRAVKDIVKQIKAKDLDPDFPLYLIYSQGMGNVEKLKEHMDAAEIKTDRIFQLGACIGVHIGPGAFGVIYVEKQK